MASARDAGEDRAGRPGRKGAGRLRRPLLAGLSRHVYALTDRFVPERLARTPEALRRVRMFLVSHIFGPFIGHGILATLFALDPRPGTHDAVLALAISAYHLFPFLLRWTGRYSLLCVLSIQNLVFIILYASYEYGGVHAPTFPWIVAAPVLAGFYLGPRSRLRVPLLAATILDGTLFYAADLLGYPSAARLPDASMTGVSMLSILGCLLYLAMMELSYADTLTSRERELEGEVETRRRAEIELRLAKEAAETASRAKSSFLASMSHELRTPLNAVIGFSEVMRDELFGPHAAPKYREYSRDINASGQHLLGLIGQILDLAKIESGKFSLDEEEFDLREIVGESTALVANLAERKAIRLESAGLERPVVVRCDRIRVKQILLNLLSNAVKFTPERGSIALALRPSADGGVEVEVADDGFGIPAADLERVLRPFEQARSHVARPGAGTGLGLPLAREFAELHGGRLVLRSSEDEGTAVVVTLPPTRVVAAPWRGGPDAVAR